MRTSIAVAVLMIAMGTIALGYEGSIVFQGGHGARALSMGGAFTALAGDATTPLWNPAGLSFAEPQVWLAGSTSNLFGVVPYQYVTGGYRFSDYVLGLGWSNAAAGTLYTANLYMGTIGVKIGGFGSLGANLKIYTETIAETTDTGFGFDVGFLVPVTPEFSVGVVAKDVGGTRLGDGTVGAMYGAGLGIRLLDGALLLGADISLDSALRLSDLGAGIEVVVVENLSVRAGIKVPELAFTDPSFSVGAGIAIAGFRFDAAFVLGRDLGGSLILSASFLFEQLFAPPTPGANDR